MEQTTSRDLLDPGTRAIIESLGIGPGWCCLEIGSGADSVGIWLAEQVAPDGEVLATDVSTLRDEQLPAHHFDLAHARLVVEHLGRRALERAAAAVRPGGWLLLEDHEWGAALSHPDGERYRRVTEAITTYMAAHAGYDAEYGRRLVHELEAAGLQDVGAAGRIRIYRGGTPTTTFMRLSIEAMSAGLMSSGALLPEDLEWLLRALDDPESVFLTPCIAAWGRKP